MAFAFFRKITVDHTKCGTADSTNYPVGFIGTYTWLKTVANGGRLQSANGFDIVFAADSGGVTRYNYERVFWSATTGVVEFWVQIPTLSHSTDTVFYVLYGDSSVTTDQSNQHATWDSNYKGVYHFPDGTTLSGNDSTSNGINGSPSTPPPSAGAGQIDGCYVGSHASGTSENLGTTSVLDITGAITVELWLNLTSSGAGVNDGLVARLNNPGGNFASWEVLFQANPSFQIQLQIANGTGSGGNSGSGLSIISSGTISAGTWLQCIFTFDGSTTAVAYLNGSAVSTLTNFSTIGSIASQNCFIGTRALNSVTNAFNGSIDEVRISTVVRSSSYVTSAYNNENSPSTFYTVGSEQGGMSGGFLRNPGMEGNMRPALYGGFNA